MDVRYKEMPAHPDARAVMGSSSQREEVRRLPGYAAPCREGVGASERAVERACEARRTLGVLRPGRGPASEKIETAPKNVRYP